MFVSARLFIAAIFLLHLVLLPLTAHAKSLRIIVPTNPDEATQEFLNTLTTAPEVLKAGLSFEQIPYGVLGPPREIASLVKEGAADLVLLPSDLLPGFAEDKALTFTFLISHPLIVADSREQFDVEDSVFGDIVAQELGQMGLVVVAFWNRASNSLLVKRKILDIADLKGLKIRTPGLQSRDILMALGATPTDLAGGEIIAALQAGVVDATEWSIDRGQPDLLKAMGGGSLLADFRQQPGFLLAGEGLWISLTQKERAVIQRAAERATKDARLKVLDIEETLPDLADRHGFTYAKFSGFLGDFTEKSVRELWLRKADEAGVKALELLTRVKQRSRAVRDRRGAVPPRAIPPTRILFATNRNDEKSSELSYRFGIKRNPGAPLTCGEVAYSPDASRPFGAVHSGPIDLARNVIKVGYDECANFVEKASEGHDGSLVLFFHGYKNSFDDAVRRAIGFSHDLGIAEPVLVWAWPSQATMSGYVYDLGSVEFSRAYLKRFTAALFSRQAVRQITVLAHSMGSRIGMYVLERSDDLGKKLANLVLIAPDVPQTIFKQSIILYGTSTELSTLYANEYDRALILSSVVNKQPPAGLAGSSLLVADGVETIDVSKVDDEWSDWNHSHGFDVPSVAADVTTLLIDRKTAAVRGLPHAIHSNNKTYWYISP